MSYGRGSSVQPLFVTSSSTLTPTYTLRFLLHTLIYPYSYHYTYIYPCSIYIYPFTLSYLISTLPLTPTPLSFIFRAFWAGAHVVVNAVHALYVAIKKITFKPWQRVQQLLRKDTSTGTKSSSPTIRSPGLI